MRHPMYQNQNFSTIIKSIKTHGVQKVNRMLMGTFRIENIILLDEMSKSNIFIDIGDNTFESEISEKTIRSIKIKDINFPFKVFAIKIKDIMYYCRAGYFGEKNNRAECLWVMYQDKQGRSTYFWYNFEDSIGSKSRILKTAVGIIEEEEDLENNKAVCEILSIIMYISMFRKDKSRVIEKTIEAKVQKKKGIPKHTLNVINLFQPKPKEYNLSGTSKTFSKKWIVRGHWRNQFYKTLNETKQIWIDPFWKGIENDELVDKKYVVA